MVIIGPPGILALMVMICLAVVLRTEGQRLGKLYVETGIPSVFLEP